jgi:predicted transposase/invertase (TIGR01784 family)
MNLFDMSPFKEKNDAFKRLLDVSKLEAMTDHERAVYEENLKIYRDWRATLEYAVEEAEEKGKAEEQRLIAANLKKQGINLETIAQCTGLSVKEIDEL